MKRIVDPGGQGVFSTELDVGGMLLSYRWELCDMCLFPCALRFSTHSLIGSFSSIHLIGDMEHVREWHVI